MSKITNDGLTQSGTRTGCFIAVYPYGNSDRQRMKTLRAYRVCFTALHLFIIHNNVSAICVGAYQITNACQTVGGA